MFSKNFYLQNPYVYFWLRSSFMLVESHKIWQIKNNNKNCTENILKFDAMYWRKDLLG